jgi:tetratricopeptide (TPR) repeat protein
MQLLLAVVYEGEGKYDDAIALYQKMFAANSLSTIPANNLASLLSDYRTDAASLDQALQIAGRFRTTDIPQFQDTLGWIYYLKGDYTQAVTLLKPAADKLPTIAAVQYHLGMAYAALGQNNQAVASLQKATTDAKVQPFPQLAKAQAELARLSP